MSVRPRAVAHDSRARVGLLPEKQERPLRQVLEQGIVFDSEGWPLKFGGAARIRGRNAARASPGAEQRDAQAENEQDSGACRQRRAVDHASGTMTGLAHCTYLTSNVPVSPPMELLLTRTRNSPGSTTHFMSRS